MSKEGATRRSLYTVCHYWPGPNIRGTKSPATQEVQVSPKVFIFGGLGSVWENAGELESRFIEDTSGIVIVLFVSVQLSINGRIILYGQFINLDIYWRMTKID